MAKNILDTTTSLVENPKRMIALAILIIVIIVLYFILKGRIKEWVHTLQNKVDVNKALNEEIRTTGETPSYADSAYRTYSQRLYNAMKGMGTDLDSVNAVFNDMRNTADVLKLISAFGTRDGETLGEWMSGEAFLSIKKINQILVSKGINYQF